MEVTDKIRTFCEGVVESIFKRWDKDHNGFLDKEEFRAKVLRHQEEEEDDGVDVEGYLERYFAKIDKDGNG